MPTLSPLALAGCHFASRSDATTHLRRVLRRWQGRGLITGRDADLLSALFAYHPRAAEKAPVAPAYFEVATVVTSHGPSQCFVAVAPNGDRATFSYRKAIRAAYIAREDSHESCPST